MAGGTPDPLDEVAPRPPLTAIPWNKVALTDDARDAVADALLGGYPRNRIAKALGTTVKTLKRLIDDDPALQDAIEAREDAEEAEVRELLLAHARTGDTVAAIFLAKARFGWRDRDDGRIKLEAANGGGVLLMPATVPLDEWSLAAARQQAQFREVREPENAFDAPHTGSPGIEGLRLVKPGR